MSGAAIVQSAGKPAARPGTSDQFPHFGSPTSQGMSPRIAVPGIRRRNLSSSVLEPDGSLPAWTFGADFKTMPRSDQSKIFPDGTGVSRAFWIPHKARRNAAQPRPSRAMSLAQGAFTTMTEGFDPLNRISWTIGEAVGQLRLSQGGLNGSARLRGADRRPASPVPWRCGPGWRSLRAARRWPGRCSAGCC